MPQGSPLAVGAPAPDLALRDQHGATFRLAEQRGRAIAIVFYPFAFSRVCGNELQALQARLGRLLGERSDVVAVSCDPVFALRAQAEQEGLDVRTLSDFWPHGEVAAAYGVLDREAGAARRSTFVVDPSGTVAWATHQEPSLERDADALVDELSRAAGAL